MCESQGIWKCTISLKLLTNQPDQTRSNQNQNQNQTKPTNSIEQYTFEKLIVTQLVKKCPTFIEPKRPFYVYKSLSLVPVTILNQMNPIHNFSPYFSMIYSNTIFPSMPWSSEWSLLFRFTYQNSVSISHLSHACHIPSHLILLCVITLTF